MSLKSAKSACTVPDTCVPTCTVVRASTVPEAATVCMMSPRVTAAVLTTGEAASMVM